MYSTAQAACCCVVVTVSSIIRCATEGSDRVWAAQLRVHSLLHSLFVCTHRCGCDSKMITYAIACASWNHRNMNANAIQALPLCKLYWSVQPMQLARRHRRRNRKQEDSFVLLHSNSRQCCLRESRSAARICCWMRIRSLVARLMCMAVWGVTNSLLTLSLWSHLLRSNLFSIWLNSFCWCQKLK